MSETYCAMCTDDEDYPECECVGLKLFLAEQDSQAERHIEQSKELEAARALVDDLRERRVSALESQLAAARADAAKWQQMLLASLPTIADARWYEEVKAALPDNAHESLKTEARHLVPTLNQNPIARGEDHDAG